MSYQLIDGKAISACIKEECRAGEGTSYIFGELIVE